MDDKIINIPLGSAYIPPKGILDMENTAMRGHMYEDMRIYSKLFSEQFPNGLSGGLSDMFTTIAKSYDISAAFDVSSEQLRAFNIAVATSPEFNIAQLNLALDQLGKLPDASFQEVKKMVVQNRSKILDTAKANHDIVSNLVEQIPEDDPVGTLVIPTIVAELLAGIDASIEFPKPNPRQLICVGRLVLKKYQGIISILLSMISITIAVCFNLSNTELSKQQHSEVMHEEIEQTKQEEQQTGYLKQIAENTASVNSADQASEEPSKNIMR